MSDIASCRLVPMTCLLFVTAAALACGPERQMVIAREPPPAQVVASPTPEPAALGAPATPPATVFNRGDCTPVRGIDYLFAEEHGVTFLFEDTVRQADRDGSKDGARAARTFLSTNLGDVRGPACVDFRLDASRNGSAFTSVNRIVLFTSAAGWQGPAPWHLAKVTAHEFGHVWQGEVGSPNYGVRGPNWLLEGTAEFVGYRSVIEVGIVSHEQARAYTLSSAKTVTQLLRTFEPLPPAAPQVNYGLVFLAVEFLVQKNGVASLRVYWSALGQGTPWPAAFQSAFGMTAEDFYSQFEAYRTEGFQ